MATTTGFTPPPYPYDRLDDLRAVADRHDGGCIDLSVGTPTDPPPPAAAAALAGSGAERGYPPSIGSPAFRDAASGWLRRRLDVDVDPGRVGLHRIGKADAPILVEPDPRRTGAQAFGKALEEDVLGQLDVIVRRDEHEAFGQSDGRLRSPVDDHARIGGYGALEGHVALLSGW